jgi:hypothetical protein
MVTVDATRLVLACVEAPDDWALRMACADALEESGQDETARAYRAVAKLQRTDWLKVKAIDLPEPWRTAVRCVSRKRDCRLIVTATFQASGFHWDGGSQSAFTRVNAIMGTVTRIGAPSPSPYDGPQALELFTADGAVVEHGTFCGKPATPGLYIHPHDMLRCPVDVLEKLAGG